MILTHHASLQQMAPSLQIIEEMELSNDLGNVIHRARRNAGLSIAELAKRIWVYDWRLEKAENGALLLHPKVLARVAWETGHGELEAYLLQLDRFIRQGKRLKRIGRRRQRHQAIAEALSLDKPTTLA